MMFKECRYDQVKFLYAYFRMIDLSLDRSKWREWNDLRVYYGGKVMPNDVIKYLKSNFKIDNTLPVGLHSHKKMSCRFKLINLFTTRILFSENELILIINLLSQFNKAIVSDYKKYVKELEELRLAISEFYINRIGSYLNKRDLIMVEKVEHFLQSHNSITLPIEDVLPKDFNEVIKNE